jgi:hypothetical protein
MMLCCVYIISPRLEAVRKIMRHLCIEADTTQHAGVMVVDLESIYTFADLPVEDQRQRFLRLERYAR